MNANSLQLFPIAAIINVIVVNLIAAVFFYITAMSANERSKPYVRYYVLFFVFVILGFVTSISRIFFSELFAIAGNNLFYPLASLSMTYALMIRKDAKINMFTNYWTYLNVGMVLFLCIFVFYLWFESLKIRIIIANANLSLITCVGAWYTQKHTNGQLSDRMLVVFAYGIAAFNFILPFAIVVFNRLDLFLVYILPFQNIQIFLWAIVLLCVLLLDTFDNELFLSTTDSMTGLKKRTYFETTVSKKLEAKKQSQNAMMMIDIDDLDRVSEFYGFQFTDEIIKHFAGLIKESLLTESIPEAKIACRLDTEEFLIFYEDVSHEYIKEQALHLQSLVADNIPIIDNKPVSYQVHIGIAMTTGNDSIYKLLKQAGRALHICKLSDNTKNIMIL